MIKQEKNEKRQFTRGYEEYLKKDRPFTKYILDDFHDRGLIRQRVFERAGVSTGYGYKILYGEKKTQNRDLILSLCLGAEMSLPQTQTVLLLYNMPLLFSCYPRDDVLIRSIAERNYNIDNINEQLLARGLEALSAQAKR